MNLPNKLTVLRIFLIPVFTVLFFIKEIPFNYVFSAVAFALAAFTDFLDGYIARKHNLVTDFGKFLDPIADKTLVSTALIIFITVTGQVETFGFDITIPFAVSVALILVRELVVSGFRMIAAGKNLVLAADKLGKAKTFSTDFAILFILVGLDLTGLARDIVLWAGFIIFAVATVLTVVSGLNYIIKNKGVIADK